MSATIVSLAALALMLGGTFLGAVLRNALPGHHLSEDSKDVVRLGSGLIATIAALVLSLLITSAKNSYDIQTNQARQMTANIILLDRLLEQYGAEAHELRNVLRSTVDIMVSRIWGENEAGSPSGARFETNAAGEAGYAKVLSLAPQNEIQKSLKDRIIEVSTDVAKLRLMVFTQRDALIPVPFLAILIFWLTIIFTSFSLFSRLNPINVTALFIFALSASGAIFLILEMAQPFTGWMQMPSATLRNVLEPL